ncbi:MAG: hypothetical protein IPM79_05135 [Polyangiaceae bacterium]|nr:hypothetical protein [Polyangiaceae bacterium]
MRRPRERVEEDLGVDRVWLEVRVHGASLEHDRGVVAVRVASLLADEAQHGGPRREHLERRERGLPPCDGVDVVAGAFPDAVPMGAALGDARLHETARPGEDRRVAAGTFVPIGARPELGARRKQGPWQAAQAPRRVVPDRSMRGAVVEREPARVVGEGDVERAPTRVAGAAVRVARRRLDPGTGDERSVELGGRAGRIAGPEDGVERIEHRPSKLALGAPNAGEGPQPAALDQRERGEPHQHRACPDAGPRPRASVAGRDGGDERIEIVDRRARRSRR